MTHDPTAQAFAAIAAGVDKDLMKDYPQQPVPSSAVSATMFIPREETAMPTTATLKAADVKRNGFTENLGTDEFVAIDDLGNVIARSDRATLERDYPNAHFFGAKDLGGNAASVEAASVEAASVEAASVEAENAGRHARTDELQAEQAKALEEDGIDLNGGKSNRKRKPSGKK